MEHSVPVTPVVHTDVYADPIDQIVAAITEIVTHYADITWMVQSAEKAVYLHAAEASSFTAVVTYLEQATERINQFLRETNTPGRYQCDPDHDRHCLDIYYLRY